MNGRKTTRPLLRSAGVAAAMMALALGGCALTVAGGDTPPRLSPAPLPTYRTGETFQFSRGRLESVAAVSGDNVVWQDERGDRERRNRDFIIEGDRWQAIPSYQAGRTSGPGDLWPLAVGRTATFITPDAGGGHTWRCRVTGTLKADVPAGRFDAFRIRCVTGLRPGPVDERIWYFAPRLGHSVVYVLKHDGRVTRRYDLIAAQPGLSRLGAAEKETYDSVFQKALETVRSGTPVRSTLMLAGHRLTVTPTATFREKSGQYCRRYVVTLGNTHPYPGIACRDGDGVWRIATR